MKDVMIGVIATGRIAVGLVEDHKLIGAMQVFPAGDPEYNEQHHVQDIHSMPMDAITEKIAAMIHDLCREHDAKPSVAGVGFPGIIREGVIEESPNLKQAKGAKFCDMLESALKKHGIDVPVSIYNDADVTATGIAATRGQLEKLVRVWTLGHGIGYGRYPHAEGVWEGGHMVVSLDPKETYCGCGGRGHLEGIMGHRAMRLRFMDMEPEEVFASARHPNPQQRDARCCEFDLMWHRALAAATASSIHMGGPGKFFISGLNARFVKIGLLSQYLHEMVTMTPLQGSVFEVVSTNEEIAIVGAAVNAMKTGRH